MYRILLVDDEPMILKGLSVFIQQSGIRISSIRLAANGREALQAIGEELPDFVFTDIRMPVMDGLALCEAIAMQEYPVQTVVVSGYGDFSYAQASMAFGVREYLLKPVAKRELADTLRRLVQRAEKQKPASAYLSVAKMDAWLEQFDQAIYYMNRSQVQELLGEWQRETSAFQLQERQKAEMLEEFHGLLVKKLRAREMNIELDDSLELSPESSGEEAFGRFAERIGQTLDRLYRKRKGKWKDPIEEAKHYIERHLASEVSLEEVADLLGLHPNYFSVMFKQATGETFVQYRTKRRMEYAKRMLGEESHRITDISYAVGYADHSNFTKTFKKYEGISPSEYRQRLGI
ncbi:response regulator [Paenibacillus sp. XY044]|uniref:response regulator transcription factor n=1 Tax=Paenibacillus sp. XY044 TaxID=2026089 RepID=UPI000B97E252|nr:response regulator [Paenibacillus sp. XY044]OZB94381.1 DNA-binding response regulator [Paenibacillus sp. XY044]